MHKKKTDRSGRLPFLLTSLFLLLCILALALYSVVWRSHIQQGEQTRLCAVLQSDLSHISLDDLPHNRRIEQQAQEILSEMTLEEKIGQLFIARCPLEDAAQQAADAHLGGYLLFGRDTEGKSKEALIADIQSYQAAASIPLFIGVDEEGGTVNRVSINPQLRATPFLSPQELYAQGGYAQIRSDTKEKCELLKSLGINLNFAPVADLSQDPNDFIYARSFGQDADATSTYVTTVIETMNEYHVGSVLKHFPGYGNNLDTHTGIAIDRRAYSDFINEDLRPFQAGIQSGATMVLVSHNIVTCLDEENTASLSSNVHALLRDELGFTGVIITDDLDMSGVRDRYPAEEIGIRAILAGNDMLCCSDFVQQSHYILTAVENGTISEERIDASVLRILKAKITLGIIEAQ